MFKIDAEVEDEPEESKWQDRISSGFDRLVAFASTELDKRRRSTEGNDCCNTSPDSGIGHGDPPPTMNTPAAALTVVPNISSPKLQTQPATFKTPVVKSTTGVTYQTIESPPIIDHVDHEPNGPPRTPSPSASPPNMTSSSTTNCSIEQSNSCYPNIPQQTHIPLRYQRFEPDHHFKKKFFHHREQWSSSTSSQAQSAQSQLPPSTHWNNNAPHHKQGKFRPKGKDWDWSGSSQQHNPSPHDHHAPHQMQWQTTSDSRYAWDHRDH